LGDFCGVERAGEKIIIKKYIFRCVVNAGLDGRVTDPHPTSDPIFKAFDVVLRFKRCERSLGVCVGR
jgi:hypothetical protein